MQVQKDGLSDVHKTTKEVKKKKTTWRWWAKALGEKASKCDIESDKVAIIRTIIFATYLITNCFIIAGVVKHWNDQTQILIQIEGENFEGKLIR